MLAVSILTSSTRGAMTPRRTPRPPRRSACFKKRASWIGHARSLTSALGAASSRWLLEAWITETMIADVERGWTRAELAEHVRDEHSTYTWLLEPMIERAGFDMIDANYSASDVFARYLCRKR